MTRRHPRSLRRTMLTALVAALPAVAEPAAANPSGRSAWAGAGDPPLREVTIPAPGAVAPPLPSGLAPVDGPLTAAVPMQEPGIGGGLALQRQVPQEGEAGSPASPVSAGAGSLNPLSALDTGTLKAFRERPLFAPSRRSPAAPPTYVPPPPPAPVARPAPDLRLVGIIAGVDRAVAILRSPNGGPSVSVKVGDMVESWRVDAISPERVVLREGEREQAYRLFAGGSGAVIGSSPGPRGPTSSALFE